MYELLRLHNKKLDTYFMGFADNGTVMTCFDPLTAKRFAFEEVEELRDLKKELESRGIENSTVVLRYTIEEIN